MTRDLTRKQFLAALERNDIGPPSGPFRYCDLRIENAPAGSHNASALNGGDYRGALAYLIRAKRTSQRRADFNASEIGRAIIALKMLGLVLKRSVKP